MSVTTDGLEMDTLARISMNALQKRLISVTNLQTVSMLRVTFECKCKNGWTGNGYNCHTKAICNNDKDCDDNADCVGDRQIQYWPYYMAHIVWLGTDT